MACARPIGRLFLGTFGQDVGLFLALGLRIPYLGKLPGDISVDRGNVHFYFPIVTCLLLSLVLTLLLSAFFRR